MSCCNSSCWHTAVESVGGCKSHSDAFYIGLAYTVCASVLTLCPLWDAHYSGTSLKVNENPADILTVILWSSSGFSSTFKLVPENCVSYML